MQYGEIYNQAWSLLGDPQGERWGAGELAGYVREGLTDFGLKTGQLRSAVNNQSGAKRIEEDEDNAEPEYAFWLLPSNFYKLERLEVDGLVVKPVPLSYFDGETDWDEQTGTPDVYLLGPWGPRTLRLYPAPTSDPVIRAYYFRTPDPNATEPEILAAYHSALVHYAVARCYLKDFEHRDTEKAAAYMALYEQTLAQAMTHTNSGPRTIPYRYL